MSDNYWNRKLLSRRVALRGAAVAGSGLAALSLVGCGGGSSSTGSATTPTSNQQSAIPDSTKGKPGGKFVRQGVTVYAGMSLVKTTSNNSPLAGYTHSGLLEFRTGRPGVDPADVAVIPDLAQALPEQPDELTYVCKIKDARFHNGRTVTAEDVKYSLDRYAFGDDSAFKGTYSWLDKITVTDAKTVVVKSKAPFADGLLSLAARSEGFILAKEHEEGPDGDKKMLGSGPFTFVSAEPPVIAHFKKNPDYFEKPYPYFDEIDVLGTSDPAKRMADYVSGQTHLTYRFGEEERDQIKNSRKDAVLWSIQFGSFQIFFRCDQAPFNDTRVRQALSMAIDRKAVREAVSKGEGEDDQVLSYTVKAWSFRKPAEMGAAAKYWKYDPQAAKQLIGAAGLTMPLEGSFSHYDPTFLGPNFSDTALLTQAQWRNVGIANIKDNSQTPAQVSQTTAIGNYDHMYLGPNALANSPGFGSRLRFEFWSPPDGVKPPTQNTSRVNDAQLSALVDKQQSQLKVEERKATLRGIEDILAEQQYRVAYSSYGTFYFSDPALRNIQVPKFVFGGAHPYTKYWWFDKS